MTAYWIHATIIHSIVVLILRGENILSSNTIYHRHLIIPSKYVVCLSLTASSNHMSCTSNKVLAAIVAAFTIESDFEEPVPDSGSQVRSCYGPTYILINSFNLLSVKDRSSITTDKSERSITTLDPDIDCNNPIPDHLLIATTFPFWLVYPELFSHLQKSEVWPIIHI